MSWRASASSSSSGSSVLFPCSCSPHSPLSPGCYVSPTDPSAPPTPSSNLFPVPPFPLSRLSPAGPVAVHLPSSFVVTWVGTRREDFCVGPADTAFEGFSRGWGVGLGGPSTSCDAWWSLSALRSNSFHMIFAVRSKSGVRTCNNWDMHSQCSFVGSGINSSRSVFLMAWPTGSVGIVGN
jgi:hypothetical protein